MSDTPPKLLDRLYYEFKGENNGRIKSWGTFFNLQPFGVKGRAGATGWGLG